MPRRKILIIANIPYLFLSGVFTDSKPSVWDQHHFQPLRSSPDDHTSCDNWRQGELVAEGDEKRYSVIAVTPKIHHASIFSSKERICAFSRGVVSAQIIPVEDAANDALDLELFKVTHPPGVDNRIRIIHITEKGYFRAQAQHVKASCEDPSEKTIILLTDEFCESLPLTSVLPSACWSNIGRHYPFNPRSAEEEARHSYFPLGPRDTFEFVNSSVDAHPGSQREIFFTVAVSTGTASRRSLMLKVAREYMQQYPSVKAVVTSKPLTQRNYRSLLLDSTFNACPGGHNPETFRMFETLESGSIPIVSREDFVDPSSDTPFPCGKGDASWNTVAASPFAKAVSVDSWDELPSLLDRIREWPSEKIDELQAASQEWYHALMRRTYLSYLEFGNGYELWPQDGPIDPREAQ